MAQNALAQACGAISGIMALQVFSALLVKDTIARTWEKLFTSECAQCR